MSAKLNRPPAGQPWIWLSRELLASDAWRSLSINGHRVIHFLMIEHMSKGGRANGNLKAPYRQLEQIGIGMRLIASAISETEEVGLVESHRGGMRTATTYTLTWLPLHDGTPPTDRWRPYQNAQLARWPQPKSSKSPKL
jgi:hypothetical protein